MFDQNAELIESLIATADKVVEAAARYPLASGDQKRVNDLRMVIARAKRQVMCPQGAR